MREGGRCFVACLELGLKQLQIRGRVVVLLALVGVREGEERRVLLRDDQLPEIVVDALQIDEVGVERLVVLEEGAAGVGAVVDGAQIVAEERLQVADERVGEAFVGLGVGPLDRDDQVRRGADAIARSLAGSASSGSSCGNSSVKSERSCKREAASTARLKRISPASAINESWRARNPM